MNETSDEQAPAPVASSNSSARTSNQTVNSTRSNSSANASRPANSSRPTNTSTNGETDAGPEEIPASTPDRITIEPDARSDTPLTERFGVPVTEGRSLNPKKGVDGYKSNGSRIAKKEVIDRNSVTDVLPYPMILAKGKAPESFRAKSSPQRAAKYPSNFEKPSYGAPT